MELANKIWNKHIEICHSGDLEEEIKANALFHAIVTLEMMYEFNDFQLEEIQNAINYLKGSKYYSENI